MPLTIVNIRDNGHLEFEDNAGMIVGTGRAHASKTHPGMLTLTLSGEVSKRLAKGEPLRIPINWLAADIIDSRYQREV